MVRSLGRQLCSVAAVTPLVSPCSLSLFYNDVYQVSLPPTHRFPMEKYRMVRETLQRETSSNPYVTYFVSPEATREELVMTHCHKYVDRILGGHWTPADIRRIGFPYSRQQVGRASSSVGGTVAAMRSLFTQGNNDLIRPQLENEEIEEKERKRHTRPQPQFACHIAGGTHHAFFDYGEGFCVFNDIAVATRLALLEQQSVERVVILDLDVHQGNGNSVLFENDANVFTFSMHCKDNYFSPKKKSNIDVELPSGCSDETYLDTLKTWLPYLLDVIKPQLVFFQAGVDIFEGDRLGRLSVTREGVSKRNRIVLEALKRRGILCVVTMGGGYPKDLNPASKDFQEIVQVHSDVYRDVIAIASSDAK